MCAKAPSRCAPWSRPAPPDRASAHRGPVPEPSRTGARCAGASLRQPGPRRGRLPGCLPDRGRDLATDGHPRQPRGLADDRGPQPAPGPGAPGVLAAAQGGGGLPAASARPAGRRRRARRRRRDAAGGRPAPPALPLLPPCAQPGRADRSDPAHRRWADHSGDRPRVPRPRVHDGSASGQGQAQDRARRHPVPAARSRPRADKSDGRCAARGLPGLQRGLRQQRATSSCGPTSVPRRCAWPLSSSSSCPTTPRCSVCSRCCGCSTPEGWHGRTTRVVSCGWTSRTGPGGIEPPSAPASRSSSEPWSPGRSVPTRCRRRSRRCTRRPRRPSSRTGTRWSRSTTSCSGSRPAPRWRSTERWRCRCATVPRPGCRRWTRWDPRLGTPAARRTRAAARAARPDGRGAGRLP